MIKAMLRTKYDHTARVEKTVTANTAKTVREVAEEVVRDMKASWSPVSPSAWGSPPAKVTGFLENSIKIDNQTRDDFGKFAGKSGATSVIRIDANYAGALEGAWLNRPFFEPALMRAAETFGLRFRRVFA